MTSPRAASPRLAPAALRPPPSALFAPQEPPESAVRGGRPEEPCQGWGAFCGLSRRFSSSAGQLSASARWRGSGRSSRSPCPCKCRREFGTTLGKGGGCGGDFGRRRPLCGSWPICKRILLQWSGGWGGGGRDLYKKNLWMNFWLLRGHAGITPGLQSCLILSARRW